MWFPQLALKCVVVHFSCRVSVSWLSVTPRRRVCASWYSCSCMGIANAGSSAGLTVCEHVDMERKWLNQARWNRHIVTVASTPPEHCLDTIHPVSWWNRASHRDLRCCFAQAKSTRGFSSFDPSSGSFSHAHHTFCILSLLCLISKDIPLQFWEPVGCILYRRSTRVHLTCMVIDGFTIHTLTRLFLFSAHIHYEAHERSLSSVMCCLYSLLQDMFMCLY